MKLSKTQMRWDNITTKLKAGVALAERKAKANDVHKFNSAIEKIAYVSARSSGQMDGFGESDIMNQLQTGSLFPDEMFGWSTKTILAVLLALLLLKVKKLQRG